MTDATQEDVEQAIKQAEDDEDSDAETETPSENEVKSDQ